MTITDETIQTVQGLGKYNAGFATDIESDKAPKGLNEDIIRFISAKIVLQNISHAHRLGFAPRFAYFFSFSVNALN